MENRIYSMRNGFKKARKRKGLSQAEVADKMGVILKTVMNWEQGISNPDLETTMKLAELFDCDIDYLVGRIEERTHDLKAICDLTGLSEDAANWIINLDSEQLLAFDRFIQHDDFGRMMVSYSEYIDLLHNASKRFVPGTPGASIGVGMKASINVENDGSVSVNSIWEALSMLGHEIGFRAEKITDSDRMTLWNLNEDQ